MQSVANIERHGNLSTHKNKATSGMCALKPGLWNKDIDCQEDW